MEVVEGGRGVGASYLLKNDGAARVRVDEVCEVVDFVVNNAPEIVWLVVLCDLLASEGFVRHVGDESGRRGVGVGVQGDMG